MIRSVILVCSAITLSNAKNEEPFSGKLNHPEDVGALHTEAFQKLADLHTVKRPADRNELLENTLTIMTSYCGKGDDACVKNMAATTKNEFEKANEGKRPLPVTEDEKLSEIIERIRTTIDSINDENNDIDGVVSELESIRQEVTNMKDTNDNLKAAVLSGISVAVESSKLWDEVYKNPEHVLHGLHDPTYYYADDSERRRLDEGGFGFFGSIDTGAVVWADVEAAISAAMSAVNGDIGELFTNIQSILMSALTGAIPASVSFFFSGAGGSGYGDEGYGY